MVTVSATMHDLQESRQNHMASCSATPATCTIVTNRFHCHTHGLTGLSPSTLKLPLDAQASSRRPGSLSNSAHSPRSASLSNSAHSRSPAPSRRPGTLSNSAPSPSPSPAPLAEHPIASPCEPFMTPSFMAAAQAHTDTHTRSHG